MAYRQAQPVQDEVELETMAEAELSRLKRQYRMMENDRVAYADDAKLQLRNQQSMIARLETEKADLVLAISAAKSRSNSRKDETMAERLKCLLAKRTKYIEMIESERQQIHELQEQIVKVLCWWITNARRRKFSAAPVKQRAKLSGVDKAGRVIFYFMSHFGPNK